MRHWLAHAAAGSDIGRDCPGADLRSFRPVERPASCRRQRELSRIRPEATPGTRPSAPRPASFEQGIFMSGRSRQIVVTEDKFGDFILDGHGVGREVDDCGGGPAIRGPAVA